jgi:hypothetical protein
MLYTIKNTFKSTMNIIRYFWDFFTSRIGQTSESTDLNSDFDNFIIIDSIDEKNKCNTSTNTNANDSDSDSDSESETNFGGQKHVNKKNYNNKIKNKIKYKKYKNN